MGESASPASSPASSIRRVALASLIGTTIEWYDFFIYGTAAALVFNKLYFPSIDPRMGTLAAFGTYAVGFIARPVGGVIVGHFGDRLGRKTMLVATLVIMGVATFLIGLLPTYAQIGPWGAVGLVALRLAQGIGVGGEWGGAVLMAIEHAPANRRGFYGSWPQMGVPAGLLLSTAVFSIFARLPEADFLSWGWRVPFLLSIALVVVGLLIRLRIEETPVFRQLKGAGRQTTLPLVEVLRTQRRPVLITAGLKMSENSAFFIYTVFLLAYGTQKVGLPRQAILNGVLLGAVGMLVALPLSGAVSDRVGRRPVYLFGAIITALFAYPLFWLFDTGSAAAVWFALFFALSVAESPMYGPQAAFISEMFAARIRYSGASLGSQLASVFAGGLSPLIATALLPYGRGALAGYLAFMSGLTIIAVLAADETRERPIH